MKPSPKGAPPRTWSGTVRSTHGGLPDRGQWLEVSPPRRRSPLRPAAGQFSPLASSRFGPARVGRRRLGGGSPERRCHFFGQPESGRAQVGSSLSLVLHRAAALPASSVRRDRGPPLADRWPAGRRSRRYVLRSPGTAHASGPGRFATPSSLGNPQDMTDLMASVDRSDVWTVEAPDHPAACDNITAWFGLDRTQINRWECRESRPAEGILLLVHELDCRSMKVSARRLPRGRRARLRSPKGSTSCRRCCRQEGPSR